MVAQNWTWAGLKNTLLKNIREHQEGYMMLRKDCTFYTTNDPPETDLIICQSGMDANEVIDCLDWEAIEEFLGGAD